MMIWKCKCCGVEGAMERNLICDISIILCTSCANTNGEVAFSFDEYVAFLQASRERETAFGRRKIKKTASAYVAARKALRSAIWGWLAQYKGERKADCGNQ